jgi:isopenicillin-N N-acyltransferase-like protein
MKKARRHLSPGKIPLVDVGGTARECGVALGQVWQAAILLASRSGRIPWWNSKSLKKLISRRTPHLMELFEGMAQGAGIGFDQLVLPQPVEQSCGCTSFAIDGSATLDGQTICGQTKDAPADRHYRYLVLRLKPTDAPAALTLTYAGMLFGHGFVRGGCAIFRNTLYSGDPPKGELPYDLWGLLALYCPTVQEVVELTRRHGVKEPFHCTICDEQGGMIGLENGTGGLVVLKPRRGIYSHANHVQSGSRLRRHEAAPPEYLACSQSRESRLRQSLDAERGRLTPQLVYAALCDHKGMPNSVCNHQGEHFLTSASVICEPAQGKLWATRGAPCQNWPQEYIL